MKYPSLFKITVDSPVAVEIIDSGTVTFWDDKITNLKMPLYLTGIDTIDKKLLSYSDCSGDRTLFYYYAKDSLHFYHTRPGPASGTYILADIHTP